MTGYIQARSQGGSEGADEPPFFSDQKKKFDGVRLWQLRVPGAIAPVCIAVGLRIHGPEPNLESVAVPLLIRAETIRDFALAI